MAIGKALEQRERKAAKERQREHGKTAPGRKNTSGKFPQVQEERRATARVARSVGMSRPTYERAKAIGEAYLRLLILPT